MSEIVDSLRNEMQLRGLMATEDDARAILTSLRRPTGGMLLSARRYASRPPHLAEWDISLGRHPNDIPFYEGLWQAMIDAALKNL